MRHTTFRVTPASRHDASAITRICLLAFKTSPCLKVIAPEYVGLSDADLLRTGLPNEINDIKEEIVGTNYSMKATVETIDDEGKQVVKIVGYATWISPDGPRKRTFSEWFLFNVHYRIRNHFFRSTPEPEGLSAYRDFVIEQRNHVFGRGGPFEGRKYWDLVLVYVDPIWQGHGVCTALLEWGFRKARESNAIIYLQSSPAGIPVYNAKGFRIAASFPRDICGIHVDAPAMVWDPREKTS